MKKIIILSRVSSGMQKIESQTAELIAAAERLGYDKTRQILIENVESAIKLQEEERQGLIKLKHLIETDKDVDCVICWEPSRLSRQQTTLYNIRDFLFSHKIQLYILNPYVKLLTDDREKIDTTASIVFSLFATISENEMILKKERFLRAKNDLKRQGKKFTGPTTFGYDVDKDKNIIPHKLYSQVIVDIYTHYATHDDTSFYETYKYISSKYPELFPVVEYKKAQHKIRHILNFKTYGEGNGLYPALVSKDIVDIVNEKKKGAKNVSRFNTKIDFLARGIARCKHCGKRLVTAAGTVNGYVCLTDSLHHLQMNWEALDWIVWNETRVAINIAASIDNSTKVVEISNEIKNKENLINNIKKYIETLEDKEQKLLSLYLDDKVNKTIYDKKYNDIISEKDEQEAEYNSLVNQINELKVLLQSDDLEVKNINVDDIEDFNIKEEYVRKYIKNVWLDRDGRYVKVSFDFNDNLVIPRSEYLYTGVGGAKKIWRINEDNTQDLIFKSRG